jgi:hypothetical protein
MAQAQMESSSKETERLIKTTQLEKKKADAKVVTSAILLLVTISPNGQSTHLTLSATKYTASAKVTSIRWWSALFKLGTSTNTSV